MFAVPRKHWPLMGLVVFLALSAAGSSAVTFSLIGPVVKMLPDLSGGRYQLEELLGPHLSVGFIYLGLPAEGSRSAYIQIFSTVLVLSAFVKAFLSQSHWLFWEVYSEKSAVKLRQTVVHLFSNADVRDNRFSRGAQAITSLLTNDIRIIREYIVHFYGSFPRELCLVIVYFSVLWLLSSHLFYLFIFGLLPSGILLNRLGKRLKKRSKKALQNYESATEWLQQRLLGIETIKQLNAEAIEVKRFERLNQSLVAQLIRVVRVKAQTAPIMEFVAFGALSLVVWAALKLIASGQVSGSILISFLSTLGILAQSAAKMGRYLNSNREGAAALSRLKKYTELFRSLGMGIKRFQVADLKHSTAIDMRRVFKKYGDNIVFEGLSRSFKFGKVYALIGASGAGKTTMARMILGLEAIDSGEVLFSRTVIPTGLCFLPQKLIPVEGPLWQTLAYPNRSYEPEKAKACFEKVGMEEFGGQLSQPVSCLSGGQLQRLFISRLFYHDYKVVILDESTSALDPETEAIVSQSIFKLARAGACVIVIAHRAAMINRADIVIDLSHPTCEV